MRFYIYIPLIFVFGCMPFNSMNKAKSAFLCKDNGGWHRFNGSSEYPVLCADGTKYSVKDLESVVITDPDYYPERDDLWEIYI